MERKTVLVVEDEPQMRRLVAIALRNRGYEVHEAGDADQAVLRIWDHRPDLIVLDAVLPDRTGFELCAELKGDPRTSSIPILMISGITQGVPGSREVWRRKFLADDYIAKPFALRDLVEGVDRLAWAPQPGGRPS